MAANNWIITEASKADPQSNLVILEKPAVREFLDGFLLNDAWPAIRHHLQATGYHFTPETAPDISTKPGSELVRCLTWMLLDGIGRPMCRLALECTGDHWMLSHEYFLGLPSSTKPELLHELLGNSRLAGCAPTMVICKRDTIDYFQITYKTGSGMSWSMVERPEIIKRANRATDVNIAMYEASIDGMETAEDVADFLSIAYEIYEAC